MQNVEPQELEEVPAMQAVQAVDPGYGLNLPGWHDVQMVDPFKFEKKPAGQSWQKLLDDAPRAVPNVPASHVTQLLFEAAPSLSLYEPA